MHRAKSPRQTKVELHMRQCIFWKILWEEKSYILQAAKTPSKEAENVYYTHVVRSCKEVLLPTFCDFTSKNGFVWTLLESFSLGNRKDFKSRSFLQDYSVNETSFKWNKFRLSMPIMNWTLSYSTHFRATCNFNTDGLVTTDYLRAKTANLNNLQLISNLCVKMEYINIRGYDCYNCTALMIQRINWHLHNDSYYEAKSCQFTSAGNGPNASPSGEDNFGEQYVINPLHRCTSANHATTQWWFGEH